MPSFGMLRRWGLLQTDVSEERVASFFRVEEMKRTRKVLGDATSQKTAFLMVGIVTRNCIIVKISKVLLHLKF
jgi:hypothetical protein